MHVQVVPFETHRLTLHVNVAPHRLPVEARRIRETLTKEITDFHHQLVFCRICFQFVVRSQVCLQMLEKAGPYDQYGVLFFFLVKEMRFWGEKKRSLMVDLFVCGCSRNGGRMDEAETGRSSDGEEKKAGFSDGNLYCGT